MVRKKACCSMFHRRQKAGSEFPHLNFMGNQSVIDDPGIKLPIIWDWNAPTASRRRGFARKEPRIPGGENSRTRLCLRDIYYQEIEPDFKGALLDGIRRLFSKPGQAQPDSR